MYYGHPQYLADERARELHRAAREHSTARRLVAAHRWSRIAAWADKQARRANDRVA